MARISTYRKDLQITGDDKLLGSNYSGVDNQGRPLFTTANYKISDLLTYFSENIDIGSGSLEGLLDDLNKVKTFYSYDENGNLTGISEAAVQFIVNSTVGDNYASASFETNVTSNVLTFNPDGTLATVSDSLVQEVLSTENTSQFASAIKLTNVAAKFGSFEGENFNLAEASIQNIFDTFTELSFANSIYIQNIESSVDGKPLVFRQDTEPSIYSGADKLIPDGSIWYDTSTTDNKVYIVSDPDDDGTSTWELTEDGRIGASAEKITNISAAFGSFDVNNNFTIDTNANYFEAVKTYADTDSATAQKIEKIGAEVGVFGVDGNGDVTFARSLSTGLKNDISSSVDQDLAFTTKTSNLGAAIGIDAADGSTLQASAQVNNTTVFTTTANASQAYTDVKVFDIAASNSDIEPGQYVTITGDNSPVINVDDVRRVVSVSGTTIELDKQISLSNNVEITFTGRSTYNIDSVSGTIRDGFQVKGNGITIGTLVSDYTDPVLTLSRAESLTNDTNLEFLGVYAAVTETSSVLADIDGNLKASYGLQVDANGNVAGMKLLADNTGSEVSFLADRFKVYNGNTAEAPFIIEDNTVKIKKANIQTLSFGDLDPDTVPDSLVVSIVYADDGAGTNQSLTKGTKNYYGIYQGQEALTEGDLPVTGVTFNQITGDTGAEGAEGAEGPPGENGLTAYFHVRYSNDNGATFTANGGTDTGNYIGTYSDNNSTASTDVADYTWVKIIGQDGIQGPDGNRVYTTNLFYQTIVTDGSTPTFDTTNLTYDFDGTGFAGIPTGWGTNPPSASPGSGTNALFYVSVNVTEGDPNVINVGNPTSYLNFNGLVTFTGTTLTDGSENFNYTAIDGAWITTGAIKSTNFTYTDANTNSTFEESEEVTDGAIFNLIDGYIKTPKLWLTSDGNAMFSGDISAASGTFGAVTIDSSGISSDNFTIASNGNVSIAGNLNGSSGTFGDVTINGNGLSSTNFNIASNGTATFSGTVSGSTVVGGVISVPTNDSNRKFYVDSQGSVYIADQAAGTPGLLILDDSNGSTGVSIASDRVYLSDGAELFLTPRATGINSAYLKWGNIATVTTIYETSTVPSLNNASVNKLYFNAGNSRFNGNVEITGDLVVTGGSSAHPNITGAGDVNNQGQTVIQSLDFDTFGHVVGTGSVSIAYPAIINNGGTPELPTGVTAAEVRSLIGAGTSNFSGSYNNLDDVPSTFPPSSHNHDDRYYTESEIQQFFDRGYLNSHGASNLAVGWYTIATNTGDRALGEFQIWDTASSDHQSVLFNASHHFGTNSSNDITVLANSRFSGTNFRYIRIKDAGTYDGAALQVYIDGSSNSVYAAIVGGNAQSSGWVLKDWVPDATAPGDVSWPMTNVSAQVDLDLVINGGIITTGEIYSGGETSQFRVLNTGDEGSGNGLDADTVDGLQASKFLRKDIDAVMDSGHTITATDFILASDQRLKSDINTYTPQPININYRDYVVNNGGDRRRVGVIAQELERNHPEFVMTNPDTGLKSVSYIDMLVAKVAELEERIKQLENGGS